MITILNGNCGDTVFGSNSLELPCGQAYTLQVVQKWNHHACTSLLE